MSAAFRRFEVLLPLQHNDGSLVAPELLAQTFDELRARFGAVSAETQTIRGIWVHEGREYRDELVRIWVDTSDHRNALSFFRSYKKRLKRRFGQLDIWITTYPVTVI
jgi:hypothetical protein